MRPLSDRALGPLHDIGHQIGARLAAQLRSSTASVSAGGRPRPRPARHCGADARPSCPDLRRLAAGRRLHRGWGAGTGRRGGVVSARALPVVLWRTRCRRFAAPSCTGGSCGSWPTCLTPIPGGWFTMPGWRATTRRCCASDRSRAARLRDRAPIVRRAVTVELRQPMPGVFRSRSKLLERYRGGSPDWRERGSFAGP
jgi:hypothetical protein